MTSLVELRILEGPNLYFPRAAVKLTLDVSVIVEASEETALRLSKLLRDNRHTVMYMLAEIARAGHFTFLCTYLGLHHADREPAFQNLRAENHVTVFDAMPTTARATKYAVEQKARRLRVAFSALSEYVSKENRNAYIVANEETRAKVPSLL